MKTLEELFLDELADIYDAENRLTHALSKLASAAESEELREAFESHLAETEGHVEKLQKVFGAFGHRAKSKKCDAIAGLLKEGEKIASENEGSPTNDAALISAAQKVEHYEIASYGCLREWADKLGNTEAASMLSSILDEEKAADAKLTELARDVCNPAAQEDEDDGEAQAAPRGRRAAQTQASKSRSP